MTDNDQTKNDDYNPDRRKFLKNTGLVVGGVAGGSLLGGLLTNQFLTTDQKTKPVSEENQHFSKARMFFSRYEDFVVLAAATELIFPKDDNGPGAIELEAPYYIDKQLAGTWGENGDDYRHGPFGSRDEVDKLQVTDKQNHARANRGKIFLEGVRTMNAESKKRFDVSFEEATEEQQGEIMTDLESGEINMKTLPSDGFFALLKQATMEGAFADPLYGGNKNMDGWRMKEFPGAQASYINVIEDEDFVEMEPVSLTDYQRN